MRQSPLAKQALTDFPASGSAGEIGIHRARTRSPAETVRQARFLGLKSSLAPSIQKGLIIAERIFQIRQISLHGFNEIEARRLRGFLKFRLFWDVKCDGSCVFSLYCHAVNQ